MIVTLRDGTVADYIAARALVDGLLEGHDVVVYKAQVVHLQQRGSCVVCDSMVKRPVSGSSRVPPQHLCGLESGRDRLRAPPPEVVHGGDCKNLGYRRLYCSHAER